MKSLVLAAVKKALVAVGCGLLGGVAVILAFLVIYLQGRPDLEVWHRARLDAEFGAGGPTHDFQEYLAAENRLFDQLQREVVEPVSNNGKRYVCRYQRGTPSDPGTWPINWNRTFELPVENPRAGVLLLHGMSDSPYSLRSVGLHLHAAGAHVIGLRIPGHGTAPSGLVTVRWQAMAAAVRLAMVHLSEVVPRQPLFIVGYSNGGALAVRYVLENLETDRLPSVAGLVLVSPAIGVTRLAGLAVWQARLGHLFGLEKLEWNSILPEYDPFKYQSFAVNAGDQVYRLTSDIQKRLDDLGAKGLLERFPPVLAFQSAVDATVSTRALVDGLFAKLPPGGHELVVFDVNRTAELVGLLSSDPISEIDQIFARHGRPFTFSLMTNRSQKSRELLLRRKMAGEERVSETELDLAWPPGVYSLSHVALPFPPDDPLYGAFPESSENRLHLGALELRGEKGTLQVPAAEMLRLKWNPFYSYFHTKLLAFTGLSDASTAGSR